MSRAPTVFLDSASWLRIYVDEAGARVALHHPRRQASVGYVDRPEIVEAATWQAALRRLLAGTGRDVDAIARQVAEKMSQLDVFGGETPVVELDWPATLRVLAESERALERPLSADEAGAILHYRRGKHALDGRCDYCTTDGREALERLRARLDPAGDGQTRSPRLDDAVPAGSSGPRDRTAVSEPRARSTDPATSHAAARSIRPGFLRDSQDAIVKLFRELGPMDDSLLVDRYQEAVLEGLRPNQSPSGIRTRRAELVDAGVVRDTGRTVRLESGRQATVWELLVDVPPVRGEDPEPPL